MWNCIIATTTLVERQLERFKRSHLRAIGQARLSFWRSRHNSFRGVELLSNFMVLPELDAVSRSPVGVRDMRSYDSLGQTSTNDEPRRLPLIGARDT